MGNSTNEVYFVIPGQIVPKQSTRFKGGYCYTPKRVKEYAKKVKDAYLIENPIQPMLWAEREPIEMVINLYFAVPKSASKKAKDDMIVFGRPTKVPDLDNCIKALCDALQGVAFNNDSQVCQITINKFWSNNAWVEVTIRGIK